MYTEGQKKMCESFFAWDKGGYDWDNIEANDVMCLKALVGYGYGYLGTFEEALRRNKQNHAKWFIQTYKDALFLEKIIEYNHLELIIWCYKNYPNLDYSKIIDLAITFGSKDIYNWALMRHLSCNSEVIDRVMRTGNLGIFKKFVAYGYVTSKNNTYWVVRNGYWKIFRLAIVNNCNVIIPGESIIGTTKFWKAVEICEQFNRGYLVTDK